MHNITHTTSRTEKSSMLRASKNITSAKEHNCFDQTKQEQSDINATMT